MQATPERQVRRLWTLTAVLAGLIFAAAIILSWSAFTGCGSVFAQDSCPTGSAIQTDNALTQNFNTAFGFTFAGTPTAARTHTLQDVTGTLYQTGGTDVALADGGTNASLTAAVGGLVYSTSSAFAISASGTANQCALSGGGGAPTWGDCYRVGGTDVALADGGTNASLTASIGSVVYSGASALALTGVGNVGDCLLSVGPSTPIWGSCATAGGGVDIQEFTATGTWTKPAGAEVVYVILYGAGGGGEKGITSSGTANGSAGGGGGARCEMVFDADDLAATETVNVPGGGPGGSGASSDDGISGGNSSFGSWITCYGGRGGNATGAGGGGCAGAGGAPTGGQPAPFLSASIINNVGCGGASAQSAGDSSVGGSAQNGGGGGGPINTSADDPGNPGGGSLFAGAGGGGGGGCASVGDSTRAGGAGGANNAYTNGTGVAGGTAPGGAGNPGASSSQGGGGGSGGASGAGSTVGGAGGAGGVPGGGGGGGGSGCDSLAPGNGGAGGRGEVRVYSFG